MCRNKRKLLCGKTEGKEHPPFFLNFFQSIKFFLMCLQKNVRRVLLTPREIEKRAHITQQQQLATIDCSLEREDIHTHAHSDI